MTAIKHPTLGCIDIDNAPTEDKVVCVKASKAVGALSVFDDSLFEKIVLYEPKHLLTWCAGCSQLTFGTTFILSLLCMMK